MKKNFYITGTLALLFTCNSLLAQPGGDNRGEKIQQLRIAFITQKLDLSPEEAEKFWPVFNMHDKKKQAGHDELRQIGKSMKDTDMSESDLLKNLERSTELKKQEADINLQLAKDLIPVIGTKKVQMLARLEQEFRETLLNKLRERRQERMDGGGPGKLRN